ncbi:MAG: D-2-hydroxyacid dehydrogenase [Candidatus Dormibacteraeota bacterium]|nr:D-2-hydroxyacid dehydrogenase [Candidatus Dormibacteraeota bacterium]
MSSPCVVVSGLAEPYRPLLEGAAPGVEIRIAEDREALAALIGSADVVAGDVPESLFGRAGRLRWVHSWAAGPNRQLYPAMVESPVLLTCSKGNGAIPLAEHAIMLMLLLNRSGLRWIHAQDEHRWDSFTHGELNGLTCGIIGLGYSGQDLALKAKAFHMRTTGVRRHPQPTPNVDQVYAPEDLRGFLAEADFVVVTAPLTPETRGMLGEAEFRSMKPTAYYICFSRGGLADDAALEQALREGWIAGAGLDAHSQEPLPEDSPFWDLPNTIVTPHNGATTAGTRRRGVEIFLDNLRRFQAGEPLQNVVDKQLGY